VREPAEKDHLKLKSLFIIMAFDTMSAMIPTCDTAWPGIKPPEMTRCECAGVSFAEVERRIREEGLSLEDVARRTGCGRTCTACLPDLQRRLADRS
jgi:bacterioferritin-associated ferredoxin